MRNDELQKYLPAVTLPGWFYVFPRSDKLDISTKIDFIAAFQVEKHAVDYISKYWPGIAEYVQANRQKNKVAK